MRKLACYFSVCTIILVVSFPTISIGKDCNLEIRKDSAASDLSAILHCLNERIKDLETKLERLENGKEGLKSSVSSIFDARTFTVSVQGASEKGDEIYIGLEVQNNTTESIFLAIDNARRPVLINQNDGTTKRFVRQQSIARTCDFCGGNDKEMSYSSILPNKSMHFNLTFKSDGGSGKLCALTVTFLQLKNKKIGRINAQMDVTFN